MAAELLKAQVNRGGRRELYWFRDERGLEVDFVLPRPGGKLAFLEAKAARTVVPSDAGALQRLAPEKKFERVVVFRGTAHDALEVTLAPGVKAQTVERLVRGP